jgi:hypothetical protein
VLTCWVLVNKRPSNEPVNKTMMGISMTMFVLATMVIYPIFTFFYLVLKIMISSIAHRCQLCTHYKSVRTLQERPRRARVVLQPAFRVHTTVRKHNICCPDVGWRRRDCELFLVSLSHAIPTDHHAAVQVLFGVGRQMAGHRIPISASSGQHRWVEQQIHLSD